MSEKRELDSDTNGVEMKKAKLEDADNTPATPVTSALSSTSEGVAALSATTAKERTRIGGKRLKYALLLSYSGRAYYGMQIQRDSHHPTIEQHLLDIFLELRLIDQDERRKPKLCWFQRAARTDKGVSAIRQVCSMMLPLRECKTKETNGKEVDGAEEKRDESDQRGLYTVANLASELNSRLPEDIRVMAVRRATKTFDAKKACERRTYAYTLPSFAFARKDEEPEGFRISEERLAEVNSILSFYEGTHNYFNFTCRRAATDASCKRYILRCQCDKPFMREDLELLTIHLTGQSFMLHQIRKMIGLCIAIIRGYAEKTAIDRAWVLTRFDVPIAPSLGLLLDEVHYDYYNKKFAGTHDPIDFTDVQDKVTEFREKFIDSVIVSTEKNEQSMHKWLETLSNHNFDASTSNSSNATAGDGGRVKREKEGSESENEIDSD